MLPNNIAGALPSACGEADLLWCVRLQSLPLKTVMRSLSFFSSLPPPNSSGFVLNCRTVAVLM